jgi:protein-S-isoprenylcysteine O-methyltransferase Ste14
MKVKTFSNIADLMSGIFLAIIISLLLFFPLTRNWKPNIIISIMLIIFFAFPLIFKWIFNQKLSGWQIASIIVSTLIISNMIESIF